MTIIFFYLIGWLDLRLDKFVPSLRQDNINYYLLIIGYNEFCKTNW